MSTVAVVTMSETRATCARSLSPCRMVVLAGIIAATLCVTACTGETSHVRTTATPAPSTQPTAPAAPGPVAAAAVHVYPVGVDVAEGAVDQPATASCPGSEELVGGGYLVKPREPLSVTVVASYPSGPDGATPEAGAVVSSWTVRLSSWLNRPGGSAVVYAVCARSVPGTPALSPQAYLESQPLAAPTMVTASCPKDRQATGGGFSLNDPYHLYQVSDLGVFPDGRSGSWTGYAWATLTPPPPNAPMRHGAAPVPAAFGYTARPLDPGTFSAFVVCADGDAVTTAVRSDPATDLVLHGDPSPDCDSKGFGCSANRSGQIAVGCPDNQPPLSAAVRVDEMPNTPDVFQLGEVAPVGGQQSERLTGWMLQADDRVFTTTKDGAAAYAQDLHLTTVVVCGTFATVQSRLAVVPPDPLPGRRVRIEGGSIVACASRGADPTDLVVSWQAGDAPAVDLPTRVASIGDPFAVTYQVPAEPKIAPRQNRTDTVTVRCRADEPGAASAVARVTVAGPVGRLTARPQVVTPGRPVTLRGQGVDCPGGPSRPVEVLFDNHAVPVPVADVPATAYDPFTFTVTVPAEVASGVDGVRVAIRCVGQTDAIPDLATKVSVRAVDLVLSIGTPRPKRPGDPITIYVNGVDCSPDGVLDVLWNERPWAKLGGVTDRFTAKPYTASARVPSDGWVKPGAQQISVRCDSDPSGQARGPYPNPSTLILKPPPVSLTVAVTADGQLDARVTGIDCSNKGGQPEQLRIEWADTHHVIADRQWTDAFDTFVQRFAVDKGLPPGAHTITAACVGEPGKRTRPATVLVPGIAVTPAEAAPEGDITVRGFYFSCKPAAGRPGTVQVSLAWPASISGAVTRQGTFQAQVRIPRNAAPGPSTVGARCLSGGLVPPSVSLIVERRQLKPSTHSAGPGAVVTISAEHFPYSCQSFQARVGGQNVPIQDQRLGGDPVSGRSVTGNVTIPAGARRGDGTIQVACADAVLPLVAEAAFTIPPDRGGVWLLIAVLAIVVLAAAAVAEHFRRGRRPYIRTRLAGPSIRVEWGRRDDDH